MLADAASLSPDSGGDVALLRGPPHLVPSCSRVVSQQKPNFGLISLGTWPADRPVELG